MSQQILLHSMDSLPFVVLIVPVTASFRLLEAGVQISLLNPPSQNYWLICVSGIFWVYCIRNGFFQFSAVLQETITTTIMHIIIIL